MTVLCILQKSLLIDFIYLGGGVTVTDGRDNWGKKWIIWIILTSCSAWGYWHLLKGPCWTCLAAAFATAHSQRFAAFFWVSASWELQFVLPLVPGTFWKLWFAEVWRGMEREIGTGLCNLPNAWLMVGAVTEEGGKTLWKVWGESLFSVCEACRNSLSLFSTWDLYARVHYTVFSDICC